jgi:hypothetical protein
VRIANGAWSGGYPLTVSHDRGAGERWLRIAADEHASIASFAVVSLQLLALGAPAELVADTHRAALDEIEHTRAALAVASAYLLEPHAMGALAVPTFEAVSFEELARWTFRDACLGETLASVRARDEAARAGDQSLEALLTRIADDEERHAELGWRTVTWLVAAGGAPARGAIGRELEELRATADPLVRDIIIPCAEALLQDAPRPTAAN